MGERIHLQKLVDTSNHIVVGASEDDVLRRVGEPMAKWDSRRGLAAFLFGARPSQWLYGTTIDLGLEQITFYRAQMSESLVAFQHY